MTKNNLHHDTALRQVMQQRAEAAESMTLADDFTDRLMERIEQHDKLSKHRRLWLYPAIGIAAPVQGIALGLVYALVSVLMSICIGILVGKLTIRRALRPALELLF